MIEKYIALTGIYTTHVTVLLALATILAIYGIYKLITVLLKVKRQRAELKRLVSEYEEFLRNRSVNN